MSKLTQGVTPLSRMTTRHDGAADPAVGPLGRTGPAGRTAGGGSRPMRAADFIGLAYLLALPWLAVLVSEFIRHGVEHGGCGLETGL